MKKIILISLAVLTSLIAILLSAATYAVATADGQQRAKNLVLGILSDNLDTPIQLDSISLEVLKGNLNLYGLLINDLKGKEMLRVDTLEVGVALGRLLFHDEIVVNRAVLSGVKATLYKEHKDSAANYQILIKPKKPSPEQKKKKTNLALIPYVKRAAIRNASLHWDVHSETPKDKGKFDANHFYIHHFSTEIKTVVKDTLLTYAEIRQFTAFERNSGAKLSLPQLNLTYDPKKSAEVRLNLSGLDAQFEDKIVRLKKLAATSGWADLLQQKNIQVDVEELYFHNDNGKPRKNLDNPKKPAFDAGHLDATANLSLLIQRIRRDSIEARVQHLDVKDSVNGLDIKNLTVDVAHRKEATCLANLSLDLAGTNVVIPSGRLNYRGKDVVVDDTQVSGKVTLLDISQPFAPALAHFTTPLEFQTVLGGHIDTLKFKDIRVRTLDDKLQITAEGRMDNVTKKHALTLDFFNIAMQAKGGIKETLVSHFAKVVRLKMLRQLQAVGDISFNGRLGVKHKLVDMQGLLHCKHADLKFNFYIDGKEKMLHGEAKSDKVNLGEIMNVKALTIGRTTAKFAINTGKNTPKGQYANKHHGRLPIGTLTAEIDEAEYGIVKVKRILADVTSNGVVAEGTIHAINSLVDADVAFEYKQTDEEQDLKTKKKVRLHKKDKKENSVKKTNKKSTKSK